MVDQVLEHTSHRFDEIASEVKDKVEPSEAAVDRYVGLEHIDAGSIRIRRWGNPSDVESSKILFRPGDIIFGKRRAYQRKLAVADFHGICSAHAMVLRPKTDVVAAEFLPFFLQSDEFMHRAVKISVGGLSPTINWGDLAREEFILPTLPGQTSASVALTKALAVADHYQVALSKAEATRLALVFEFENEATRGRLVPLGSLVDGIEAGKSPPSSGREAAGDEWGVLKVSAVGDWDYFASENKVIDREAFREDLQVAAGDFLVTRANADPASVGRTCIVGSTPPNLMLSDKTWRLRMRPSEAYPARALLAWTKSRSFRTHVRKNLNGTDAKNISQKNFLSGLVPEPGAALEVLETRAAEACGTIEEVRLRLIQIQRVQRELITEVLAR